MSLRWDSQNQNGWSPMFLSIGLPHPVLHIAGGVAQQCSERERGATATQPFFWWTAILADLYLDLGIILGVMGMFLKIRCSYGGFRTYGRSSQYLQNNSSKVLQGLHQTGASPNKILK